MKYIPQDMPEAGSTVVVGMSGGVDSTLTALLLKQKGCNVIGVTMSLWDGHIKEVQAEKAFHDACYSPHEREDIEACKKFCAEQNIQYHVIDVSAEYNREVLDYFTTEYRKGRTPNPCIRCNRFIKFGALLEGIKKINITYDYFCTGHYAMVVRPDEGLWGTDEKPYMVAGAVDFTKDQTYFLYRLPSEVLEKVRFPLASLKKSKVFELARNFGLEAAEKEESQDFIDAEYFDQLFADKPSVPGDIVDTEGKILGRHNGIEHYTIGQRKGLGVSVNYPVYVKEIDAQNNRIILAPKDELSSSSLIAEDMIWPGNIIPKETFSAIAKIRLRSKSASAQIQQLNENKWLVTFDKPQNAITPGQSLVLYKDNVIIGGGIISSSR